MSLFINLTFQLLSNTCHTVIHPESPEKTLSLTKSTSESKDSRVRNHFVPTYTNGRGKFDTPPPVPPAKYANE